jgi:RNA polymerase primary sigma factor
LRNDKNALSDYLRSLYDVPVLTHEEEVSLGNKIKAGDMMARDKLIQHNLRFVVSVVKNNPNWMTSNVPMEDLIQFGNEGLLLASSRWEPQGDTWFCRYAKKFIESAVMRGVENTGTMIRLPVNIGEQMRKMQYVERRLTQELGREPKLHELADALEVHNSHVSKLKGMIMREPVSLDAYNQEKFKEEGEE